MATFAGLVRPGEKRQDGTWNVKIRVTHKGVAKYIKTPFYVTQNQLTRSFKIKDARVLDLINAKVKEYRETLDKIGFTADTVSVDRLVELLNSAQNRAETIDFMPFFLNVIDGIRAEGRISTANSYIRSYKTLLEYNKRKPLLFSNITSRFVLGYYDYLKAMGLSPSTMNSYIYSFSAAYKAAQIYYNDDDLGIIVAKHGVFDKLPSIRREETKRTSLTREQMQAIIDLPYTGVWREDFVRDMFVLSFLCFGINAKDLFALKKSQYKDGIISYRRQKIKRVGSKADMQIRLSEPARIILEKYSGDKEYLINFRGRERYVSICRNIHGTFQRIGLEKSKGLDKGEGTYVFYTCRHTMATLARNECGIEYMTIHQMLNHAVPAEFKTTDIYVHRDFTPLWEANDKLVALFDWSFYLAQKKKD